MSDMALPWAQERAICVQREQPCRSSLCAERWL